MRRAMALALAVMLLLAVAWSLDEPDPVEVVQGNILGGQLPIDGPPLGVGLPAWTVDGAAATITSAELIADPVTTCTADTEFWTSGRGIGSIFLAPDDGLSPFEPFQLSGSFPQVVASVDPGPDCEPGDVIAYSGFRVFYNDRGFPKSVESPMRIEVLVVTEINAE